MDELKNMVIQTLETNGILGQLRAQLRSCVFKVIDNQDQVEKGKGSGFHWENKNARQMISSPSGVLCAELFKDFLEFYKLDYTLSIFLPEANLNNVQASTKEELSKKFGLSEIPSTKPVMMQLLENLLSNEIPHAPEFSGALASYKQAPVDSKPKSWE
jgi:FGFR1 oncogene partner